MSRLKLPSLDRIASVATIASFFLFAWVTLKPQSSSATATQSWVDVIGGWLNIGWHWPLSGAQSASLAGLIAAGGLHVVAALVRVRTANSDAPAVAEAQRDERNARAQVDGLRKALEDTQREREDIRGQLGTALEATKTCKRQFGIFQLTSYANTVKGNLEEHNKGKERGDAAYLQVNVTIRFVGYGPDFVLAQQIEKVLKAHTDWKITLDGSNNPTLMPDDQFKVIFVLHWGEGFGEVGTAFVEGGLIDASIGFRRDANAFDFSKLVIEVLPTRGAHA